MKAVERLLRVFHSLGPYLAIEMLLPGGSVVALLLWTYRHRAAARKTAARIASDQPAYSTGS
jgi:hypothetical protein